MSIGRPQGLCVKHEIFHYRVHSARRGRTQAPAAQSHPCPIPVGSGPGSGPLALGAGAGADSDGREFAHNVTHFCRAAELVVPEDDR